MAKPFYTTSEFWVVVLTVVGNVAFAAVDKVPARYASIASAIAAGAYALARGLAKRPPAAVPVSTVTQPAPPIS